MAFADKLKKLDAHRLQQSVKATVQSNGRLTFTVEATKEMGLSEDKSLVIFEAEGGDLGAVISVKDDPEAFVLKKCGLYFYVAFKNYLQQAGIDYKNQRIIYDITELDERIEGKTLYQFARRVLPKSPEPLPLTNVASAAGDGNASSDVHEAGQGMGNDDAPVTYEPESEGGPIDDYPFDEEGFPASEPPQPMIPASEHHPLPTRLPTRPPCPPMPRCPSATGDKDSGLGDDDF